MTQPYKGIAYTVPNLELQVEQHKGIAYTILNLKQIVELYEDITYTVAARRIKKNEK